MRRIALLVTAAAAAVALAGLTSRSRSEPSTAVPASDSAGTPVRVVPVETALGAEPVRATGVVAGKDETRLGFKIGGVVQRIAVNEGDAVRAGQTLARLASAERSYALVARRYGEGMATLVELLDARTAFTAAGLNRIVTTYDYWTRRVELERAAALYALPAPTDGH